MRKFIAIHVIAYLALQSLTNAALANPDSIPYPIKSLVWTGIAFHLATWLSRRQQPSKPEQR
jgi:hypothetical protein